MSSRYKVSNWGFVLNVVLENEMATQATKLAAPIGRLVGHHHSPQPPQIFPFLLLLLFLFPRYEKDDKMG